MWATEKAQFGIYNISVKRYIHLILSSIYHDAHPGPSLSCYQPKVMSALEGLTFPSMVSDTEHSNTVPTKYPHTRAILAAIAASVKLPDTESLDPDQDSDEGQRISPALVSRVVTLLQEEKEDELKEHLRQAFSIPDTVVSFTLLYQHDSILIIK